MGDEETKGGKTHGRWRGKGGERVEDEEVRGR
jgi:hypothetical protein